MTLALFATPGIAEGVLSAADPLVARGFDVHYVSFPGQQSSAFIGHARSLRGTGGRLLPHVIDQDVDSLEVPPDASTLFVGFSAGCWFARDGLLVNEADRAQISGCIFLDGLHATESQLAHVLNYVDEGGQILVVHSDALTSGYPSTTETVETLRKLRPDHPGITIRHSPGSHSWRTLNAPSLIGEWLDAKGLRVSKPPNTIPTRTYLGQRGEAVKAWQWYIGATIDGYHGPQTERYTQLYVSRELAVEVPELPHPLGLRRLYWVGMQVGANPIEVPGPQHHPLILSYSTHCRRGGAFLGVDGQGNPIWDGGFPLAAPSDEWAWCAAAMSEALRVALRPGENAPHGLRVAVWELVEDLRAKGRLRYPDDGYKPQPGDLAFSARIPGESPLRRGRGHVEVVYGVSDDPDRVWLAGGNESDGTHAGGWRLQLESTSKVIAWGKI